MAEIKIPKDIFAKDKYGVKRRVFVAGQIVEGYVVNAVLRNNTVLNPEDLGVKLKDTDTKVFSLQTKTLTDTAPTLQELKDKEEKPKSKKKTK
jgi:hypothetical protein